MYTPVFLAASMMAALSSAFPFNPRDSHHHLNSTSYPTTVEFCAGKPYTPGSYTCYSGYLLCPKGTMPCGGDAQTYACFSPTQYRCVNETLVQIPEGVLFPNGTLGGVAAPTGTGVLY